MTAAAAAMAAEQQARAADPAASVWVAANAGSGKTKVLTDRVARLLLGGVAPERILCLTYTKAAAAEMQNRLFRRLGDWAMLEDGALRAELAGLGGPVPQGDRALRAARRLFARAIDAPGGLKIQTIHAFCAGLLRRFPLEAGVPPDFREIDDRARRLLIEDIVDAMADGTDAASVAAVARHHTGETLADVAAEIAGRRRLFAGSGKDRDGWLAAFGLPAGYTAAALHAEVFRGGEAALVAALLPLLAQGKETDVKCAAALAAVDLAAPGLAALEALEGPLLTGSRAREPFAAKIGALPTKALREGAAAPLMPAFEALMARVETGRTRRAALLAAERGLALQDFARPFLAAYAARKLARGALDFDDLILKAGALLARPGVADWVLYRLDGGIDHVLVDEAQDTSPEQWEVVRLIADAFTAGEGARSDVPRSLFVVGDPKQSIYSFQGADPSGFGRMQDHFGTRLSASGGKLDRVDLPVSFRSAPEILRLVDATFAEPGRNRGLGGAPEHVAASGDLPGRVDFWPAVPEAEKPAEPAWDDPLDRVDAAHHDVTLARLVAAEIARLCDPGSGETLPLRCRDEATGDVRIIRRAPRPGDVLVLVRRRSTLFAEVIRACKALGLPIAGADRLRLGGELAVRDLAALLSFLATPEDDLSLAALLRSPLFGWSEDRLFRLAHGRPGFLWEALRPARTAGSAEDRATLAVLDDLRSATDFLRPFELLERVLTRHDGRRRLLARLGPEAEDGIDALLAQALAYEAEEPPSLTGFLGWMETDDIEVKRQLSTAAGVVRVMTIHGAKGLEAPLVILPDTRPPRFGRGGVVLPGPEGGALWRPRAEDADATARAAMADAAARAAEEEERLLYVALTRAESWLVIAGAGQMGAEGQSRDRAWHEMVRRAMVAAGADPADTPAGPGLRLSSPDWLAPELLDKASGAAAPPPLPAWAAAPAPAVAAAPDALSPSDLGGAKVMPGEAAGLDEAAARRRGRQLHLLFEHLPGAPAAVRAALAARLLAAGEDAATGAEAAALSAEAARVIDDPAFAPVFAPGTLAEVEIAAALPQLGGRLVAGMVDRLSVSPDLVVLTDFKTNALVPAHPGEVPEGILRQIGAYAACLELVFPGRAVETALLWTAVPVLMPLPREVILAALGRATLP